jgi:hypothetical protein
MPNLPTLEVQDLTTGQITIVAGGIPGPRGPAGPAGGPQGPQGDQGPEGVEGPRGPQGLAGDRGPQGPQGLPGLDGQVGPPGAPGALGPKGDKGDAGPGGSDGVDGADGTRGPIGPRGDVGPQGNDGIQGLQGDKGDRGPAGPQGIQGNPGVAGPTGSQGLTGAEGPRGPKGDTGSVGPKGDNGAVGLTGAPGATGPKGDKGDKGDRGETGPQGIDGPIGLTGPAGPSNGPQGDPGDPGVILIQHDTDGTVERPDAPIVYWVGSAVPLNAAATDFWYGSTSSDPTSFAATLAQAQSYADTKITALRSSYRATDAPTVGETVPRRGSVTGPTGVPVSGNLFGGTFIAEKTETISNVTLYCASARAGGSPTFQALGVWELQTNGNYNLVGSFDSDLTLFAANDTTYSKALTVSFQKTQGKRYYVGLLIVQPSGTLPTFYGTTSPAAIASLLLADPPQSFKIAGQSSLPATITPPSLTNVSQNVPLVWMQ